MRFSLLLFFLINLIGLLATTQAKGQVLYFREGQRHSVDLFDDKDYIFVTTDSLEGYAFIKKNKNAALARKYFEKKDFERAYKYISLYLKELEVEDMDCRVCPEYMARIKSTSAFLLSLNKNRPVETIKEYSEVINYLDKSDHSIHFPFSQAFDGKEISLLIHSLSKQDIKEFALSTRGFLKYELEDYRGALSDFKKLYSIEGGRDKTTTFMIGIILFDLEKYDQSFSFFNKTIESGEGNAGDYFYAGLSLIYQDKKEGCLFLSKSGEMGNKESYDAIKMYCTK